MPIITAPMRVKRHTNRRPPGKVLKTEDPGASPAGNSFWKEMRLCPRAHALRSLVKLRRKGDSEALTLGFLFHYALEIYYKTIQRYQEGYQTKAGKAVTQPALQLNDEDLRDYLWGASGEGQQRVWKALKPLETEPGYDDTYNEVCRLLAAYFVQWGMTDPWRIVAVEETLEYEDASPDEGLRYSARLDLIIEHIKRGGLWVVEHKTTKVVTMDLLEGYQMDQQILGQMWLLKRCVDLTAYPPLNGVLVNITTKHKPPRFERVEVCPSKYHLAAFEQSLRAHKVLERHWADLSWPQYFGNCAGPARYWSRCDYFDMCHGQPELSVEDWQEQDPPFGFVKEEVNR